MKWLTPFILFTIIFAVAFSFLHAQGFDDWPAAGKALGTLACLGVSILGLLASAYLIAHADAIEDEQQQSLIHALLGACSASSASQAENAGSWSLVLDRRQGGKYILRWRHTHKAVCGPTVIALANSGHVLSHEQAEAIRALWTANVKVERGEVVRFLDRG